MATLADTLTVLAPAFNAQLFDGAARAAIDAWASSNPAIPWMGFECRLGGDAGATGVDCHQGLRESTDAARWLDQPGNDESDPALTALCRAWLNPTTLLGRRLSGLIFEFDGARAARTAPPCIFLGLPYDEAGDAGVGHDERVMVVRAALASLAPPHEYPPVLLAAVERCIHGCPDPAVVSHVGVMRSRANAGLRLNVKHLRHDAVATYLADCGWPGFTVALDALLGELFAVADRITICLDIGADGKIAPALGLECAVRDDAIERWAPMLDYLVARRLCTPNEADALRAWPGRVTPAATPSTWPESWIVAALSEPAHRFDVVDRYLSHVKLTWEPTKPNAPRAKAYLGGIHRLITPRPGPPAPAVARVRRPRDTTPVGAATAFLLDRRTQGGWWEDYPRNGRSDEWVTAYVGATMAAVDDPRARRAANRAWQLLGGRRQGGEWGFAASAPPDADSTAWALRLARAVGAADTPSARAAAAALARYRSADGGVATYIRDPVVETFAQRSFARAAQSRSAAGWCQSHTCVTAAVAPVVGAGHDFLRRAQESDGRWVGYWWTDDEYTTALAVEALAATGRSDDRRRLSAAAEWAESRLCCDDGDTISAFRTAWRLRIFTVAPRDTRWRARAAQSMDALVAHQRTDGSWHASALLRIPPPDACDPVTATDTIVAVDDHAIFTTATVLMALVR